jgi:multiple sugar transport system ATP-binding protein
MNFIPCQLEAVGDRLQIRLTDQIALPLPPDRVMRYRPFVGRDGLILGIRPEHLTEPRAADPNAAPFETVIQVVEPMGMETLVYFTLNGLELCGRVSPNAGARENERMRMAANLDHMHLIDDASGHVL